MFITFLLFGNDVISLESRSLIFIYLYTRTQSIRKEIVQYNIKSKYPEEYFSEEILSLHFVALLFGKIRRTGKPAWALNLTKPGS